MEPLAGKCPSFNGEFFSKSCTLVVADALGACVHCKYQRKLILNQLSRRRRQKVSAKPSPRNIRHNLRRTKAKLSNARISLSHMKTKNEQLSEKAVAERIRGLPEKQRAAVKACFEAAQRKSRKGMRYENEWHLE